jgi:multiple antibiotic resistance protein
MGEGREVATIAVRSCSKRTVGIVAICLVVVVLIFFAAEPINRAIGRGGLGTMSRVMGLILSSIAVTNGVTAIKVIFGLA